MEISRGDSSDGLWRRDEGSLGAGCKGTGERGLVTQGRWHRGTRRVSHCPQATVPKAGRRDTGDTNAVDGMGHWGDQCCGWDREHLLCVP